MHGFELIVCDGCGTGEGVELWIASPPAKERIYLCGPCRFFWESPEGQDELERKAVEIAARRNQ